MENAAPLPIVDCHQHLWAFAVVRPPWLSGAGLPLEQSHTPDDYRQASAGSGIVQSVYVEVGASPQDRLTEAGYAAARCADAGDPLCAIVAGGDLTAPDFPRHLDELTAIAGPYLRGIRSPLPRFSHQENLWQRNAAWLGERGLHVEMLTRPPVELGLVARFAQNCPGTRFLVNHCGGISPWDEGDVIEHWADALLRAEEYANVAVKLSGLVNRAPVGAFSKDEDRVEALAQPAAGIVNRLLPLFHPRRVVWGSDWPVCNTTNSLAEWVAVTRRILDDYPRADREAILHGNAQNWYRLPPPAAATAPPSEQAAPPSR